MKAATRRTLCLTLSIFSFLGLLSLAGCSSTPFQPAGDSYNRPAPAPDWHGMTLSWSKLERIQTWLDSAGPTRWPDALPGAELELAQGRLKLATDENGKLPKSIISARLDRAESGFKRVLANTVTSSVQRREASSGLTRVRAQRSSSPNPSKAEGIIPRRAWGAKNCNPGSLNANRRAWRRITVHHSTLEVPATDFGSSAMAVRRIQKEHMARIVPGSSQHWGDIGYHFLIDSSGRIFQGRSLDWRGAHAGNSTTNEANLGICLLGNFNNRYPSSAALASLEQLIRDLSKHNGIGQSEVYAHLDFKNTECPGTQLLAWVRRYSGQG